MRKLTVLITLLVMVLGLSACSSEPCELCEEHEATHTLKLVTEFRLCDDCYADILDLNFDTGDSYDYSYSYDDSDDTYYNSDSYSTSGNRCRDCGASIDEDRFYCDKCLGYGTCQDCGISIGDDRLYCDKCLGYGTCQDCGISIDDDRLYCDKCLGYGVCQDCGKSIDDDRLYCDSCLFD